MNRFEVEEIRQRSEIYHVHLYWGDAIKLCDIILGREVLGEAEKPKFEPYPGLIEGAAEED